MMTTSYFPHAGNVVLNIASGDCPLAFFLLLNEKLTFVCQALVSKQGPSYNAATTQTRRSRPSPERPDYIHNKTSPLQTSSVSADLSKPYAHLCHNRHKEA